MYYNSNQNSNDYYSSYKKEISTEEAYETANSFKQIAKVGIKVLLLGFMGVGSVYLFNHLSTEKKEQESLPSKKSDSKEESETLSKIILDKEILPKSIQLQESQAKILEEIQMNATDTLKEDSPNKSKEHNSIKNEIIALPETSNLTPHDIDHIVNLILKKQNEQKHSSLEEELLSAETESSPTKTLQESNHYNKVVLSSHKETNGLDKLLSTTNREKESSNYEKSLKRETRVRNNEMRIIIVKKGDTLSKLAKKAYGDMHAYKKIFKANPEIIKNPNQIFVGQKIRIPS